VTYPSPEREPYIFHPLRLMLQFHEPTHCIAAVLHDVVEDTPVTLANLSARGFNREVLDAVDALTRREDEACGDYIDRVAVDPVARAVKLADLRENLRNNERLDPTANRERIGRYTAAIALLSSVDL
jgi:(p)ppGpp synthase/HD superfamily hydrolase